MKILYNTNGGKEMKALIGFYPAHNGMCLEAVSPGFTLFVFSFKNSNQ